MSAIKRNAVLDLARLPTYVLVMAAHFLRSCGEDIVDELHYLIARELYCRKVLPDDSYTIQTVRLIVFQPWFEEGESPESVFIHEVLKAEHPYMKKREA
jgi:hypothetical protein